MSCTGGHIQSIKVGNVTYTYHPDTGNITANDGHNPPQHTSDLTVTTPLGGTLEFNIQTGAAEYSAPAEWSHPTPTDEKFDYVVIDNDGDTRGCHIDDHSGRGSQQATGVHPQQARRGEITATKCRSKSYDNSDGSKEGGLPTGANPGISRTMRQAVLFASAVTR